MKVELKKDIYADLEKIEERGKKKKKGFSLFGRGKEDKDEPGKEDVEQFADLKPASKEHGPSASSQTEPVPPVTQQSEPDPPVTQQSEPAPVSKPAPTPPPKAAPTATPVKKAWHPPTGRKRQEAEHQLKNYKRKLNKAFVAKKLTKEQCMAKVEHKEIELGLKPPK